MRRFIDAPYTSRCAWSITLKDGSKAQCGRHAKDRGLCMQHRKMRDALDFKCCGGNDDHPPEHTMDCETRIK